MAWSYSYQNEHCEILSKLMENPIGYIHYSACGILYNADLPPPPCKLTGDVYNTEANSQFEATSSPLLRSI